ncbi:hypothetical protein [Pedosphaera parvula]|uniref:Signal peptide protein n=1 Tax=Pedosphaera parvula (strain Ellin514) TaxID=320771 RepID=B9XR36_PEDPL|nr:hypothetical protein [Pedosphaera parvula]EEF57732.1 signal peptide protein [Pedosphaera parvula Ellin514]
MKKILLLSAVLVGAVSAAQAGVGFHIGIGLPLLPPPPIIIGRPAPVYVAPAPVYVEPRPVFAPPPFVVVAPPSYYYGRPGYYGYGHRDYDHRGWERGGDRGHGHGW